MHPLRHSYASHLVVRGVSLAIVRELLGHSTLPMVLRYTHLETKAKHEAVQVLDSAASVGT